MGGDSSGTTNRARGTETTGVNGSGFLTTRNRAVATFYQRFTLNFQCLVAPGPRESRTTVLTRR